MSFIINEIDILCISKTVFFKFRAFIDFKRKEVIGPLVQENEKLRRD